MASGDGQFVVTHHSSGRGTICQREGSAVYVRWHERVYEQDDQGNDRLWHQRRELKMLDQDMKESLSSSSGSQFFENWFIATIKKEPIEPNPKTNGLKTMESSYTLRLNGPPEEICY